MTTAAAAAAAVSMSSYNLQMVSLTKQQQIRVPSVVSVVQLAAVTTARRNNLNYGAITVRNGRVPMSAVFPRRELLGASLKGLLVPRRNVSLVKCVLEEATTSVEVKPEEEVQQQQQKPPPLKIWLSNVVVRKCRNYFKNRQWTSKDLTYAGFMAFMHGLCLFAPATFSWNAFGVFLGLYVITGMLEITLSYHQNLSHMSFKVPKWLEYTFAYCGVQAV